LLSQEPRLFGTTIADNIAYGCPGSVSRADVEAAAREANAHDFITALPAG
jgi:ATP-binding cassette subfamily B protein